MKIKIIMPVIGVLSSLIFTACNSAIQQVEVTRLVPQTVEVTKIISQTEIVIQSFQITATLTPKPTMAIEFRKKPDQSTAYYEGIVVLAQYYTLLDQGLYSQAYQLLSAQRPDAISLEEFLGTREMINIYHYRLISAQPYPEWVVEQGYDPSPDTEISKRFYIQVYAEGEGGMAGSVTNGVHPFFATVIWEDGEWKIFSINTSP